MLNFFKEKFQNKKDAAPAKRRTKDKRQKSKKKTWIIIGVSALSLILVLLIAGIIICNVMVDHYLEEINVVTKETDLVFDTEAITFDDGSTSVVEDPDHNGELNADNLPLICNTKHVKNYLLLAVDSRGKEAGLSDSMILLSVNTKTGKIVLCSFMRDILAKYPAKPENPVAGKYDKLNHSHSYGGPELTMAVLKETFNIEVSQYAKINFSAFRNIVDAMGGLDMYLSSAEVSAINSILSETMQDPANQSLKVTSRDMLQNKGSGTYHLSGVQALSHARNRRVGSDYARTQRQRDLIQTMAKKATTLSLTQLDNLLTTVLPLITTNIPKDVMKDIIGDIPSYLTYDIQSTRVPGDGMFTEKNYNLIPDLEKNCFALYELIYGEKAPGAPTGSKPLTTKKDGSVGGKDPVQNTTTTTTTSSATTTTTTEAQSQTPETTTTANPDTTSSSVTTTPTTTTKKTIFPTTTTKPETPPQTSSSVTTTTSSSEDDTPPQNGQN